MKLIHRIGLWLGGMLLLSFVLLAVFGDYILQQDLLRQSRDVTIDAKNILGQYGLNFVLDRQDLQWDWVIVEGKGTGKGDRYIY